jgi:hypothetical protein
MATLKDLRAEAKAKGLKNYSKMSKADLEQALGHGDEAEHKSPEPVKQSPEPEPVKETTEAPKEKKAAKPNAWREYARNYQAEHKIEKYKDALAAAAPSWHAMKAKTVETKA